MAGPLNSATVEEFVRWFLRLNGYFGVENFIVHAADDPSRISGGLIAPHTETDTIAVRMPYSTEVAGTLKIANYPQLTLGSEQRFDVVIAESKAGEDAKPNRVWRNSEVAPVAYIVRFVGLHLTDDEIGKIASALSTQYRYEDQKCRFRYIVFSREPNEHYASRGVTYIDLRSVVNFLVDVRGQCWIDADIGVASIHHQWNPLIKQIFALANDLNISVEARRDLAYRQFLELAG